MKRFALPVALVVVAGGLYLLLTSDSGEPKLPAPEQTTPVNEVTEVVYSRGTRLFVFDLGTGDSRPAGRVPTKDFQVSPDGELWAATNGVPQKRDPDPRIEPTEIILGEVGGEVLRSLGIGYSPVWSPDGEDVAAVTPVDGYLNCPLDVDPAKAKEDPEGQGCTEGERVVYYDVEERDPRIALGAGAWEIIGWTGADRIVGYSSTTKSVMIGFANSTFEQQVEVPVFRKDILAVSPSERLFLMREGDASAITDAEGGSLTEVDVTVRSAHWSPSGDSIAVVSREGIVLVTVADGEQDLVENSGEVHGPVVWSADGATFTFLTDSSDGTALVVCRQGDSDCDSHGFPRAATLRALR